MLVGDASYLEATMLSGTVDGVSPDETVVTATFANIRALCAAHLTVYLSTYDLAAGARLEARRVVAVRPDDELRIMRPGSSPGRAGADTRPQ